MSDQTEKTPLFHYVIEIEHREFPLIILPDRTSQWDDHTGRHRIRHPHDRHLELRAFAGDRRAFYQLKTELVEFTISTAVPEKIFLKAMELAQKEKVEEALTGQFQEPVGETAEDIVEMDRLLEDFFGKRLILC